MDNCYHFENQAGTSTGHNSLSSHKELGDSQHIETPCLLCEDIFNIQECQGLNIFMKHLLEVHGIIIEDYMNIYFPHEYIKYYREKFKSRPMEQFVPSVSDSDGTKFFFISSLIKGDKDLRHQLRLNYLLKVQEFERTDDKYTKSCSYCNLEFEGKRQDFLHHLSSKHNLQLGDPNNLVFIEELIEKIDKKFGDLICLYCEKKFPERHTLKEHMRKKLHKRINHENKEYDKYFMVNYLEDGKTWLDISKEPDRYAIPLGASSDDEYSDWTEEQGPITCLFCRHKEVALGKLCEHMISCHNFDFEDLVKSFSFFQKIQLINYIRRQVSEGKCIYCDDRCDEKLERHMKDEGHYKLPKMEVFDRSDYLLPTYEEDAFLYLIEDQDLDE